MSDKILDFLGNLLMFVAVFIVAANTPKRKAFFLRYIAAFIVFCAVRYLYFYVFAELFPSESFLRVRFFGFLMLMIFLCVAALVSFRCSVWAGIFLSTVGYSAQHICKLLLTIFLKLLSIDRQDVFLSNAVYVACMAVLTGLLIFIMWRLKIKEIVVNNNYIVITALLVIIIAIALSLKLVRTWTVDDDVWYSVRISEIIMTILNLMFLFSMLVQRRIEIENNTIKKLLEEAKKQFVYEKKLIEEINIRMHDIKHQINARGNGAGEEITDEMKGFAETYDSNYRTGNIALDIVFSRYGMLSKKDGVELTFFGDGRLVDFMTEADVYSLFGNILENAMEATEKLTDKEKRVITVYIESKGHFVHIHAENYFDGKLIRQDGVFVTTKKERELHGYGLKSVKMITEKYDGDIKIFVSGNRFIVDILFDNPETINNR